MRYSVYFCHINLCIEEFTHALLRSIELLANEIVDVSDALKWKHYKMKLEFSGNLRIGALAWTHGLNIKTIILPYQKGYLSSRMKDKYIIFYA